MKIGVLGTGDVGRTIASGLIETGHSVMIGSRSATNEAATGWAAENGAEASAGTFADAAKFGELIVFAVKGSAIEDVVKDAGPDNFAGKVVIDTTNPLDFSHGYPDLFIKGDDSAGQMLQRLLPDAQVVKAFNIVNYALMFRPDLPGGPPDMLIAGDDNDAKQTVTKILSDFGWPAVDIGGISSARWLEAMCMAWVMACMGTQNWRQAFKLLKD